jgi:hypothetical protein
VNSAGNLNWNGATINFSLMCFFRVQYHPDVNKQDGAEEKFKEIANAYEVRL